MPEQELEGKYQHVAQLVFGEPWAIKPEMYALICDVVRSRRGGGVLSAEEVQQRIGAAPIRSGAARHGAVAVLPLHGILGQRMNMMANMSGGTSTEQFGAAFRQAIADPDISAVVMDVDSPGGSVFGVQELWQTIFEARGPKPIVAVANSTMASAAYWIASAADEIVVTPGGEVGSIGIVVEHQDVSAALEIDGIKPTLITAGKHKAAGNMLGPLEDDARADIQAKVDTFYGMFVGAVAKGRGVRAAEVRGGFGEGATVLALAARELGMVDRVATLDQTIARLMGSRNKSGSARAGGDELAHRRMALW